MGRRAGESQPAWWAEARRLKAAGWKGQEIADHFGVQRAAVIRAMKPEHYRAQNRKNREDKKLTHPHYERDKARKARSAKRALNPEIRRSARANLPVMSPEQFNLQRYTPPKKGRSDGYFSAKEPWDPNRDPRPAWVRGQ
jgi:hypothetical protein